MYSILVLLSLFGLVLVSFSEWVRVSLVSELEFSFSVRLGLLCSQRFFFSFSF